ETLVGAVEMPVGTTADATKERLLKLSDAADDIPEVQSVQMFVALQVDFSGAGMTSANMQPHLGQLVIELLPADQRERREMRSSMEVLAQLRESSATLAGVNSVTWEAISGGPGGKDVHIQIAGRDFDEIRAVAEELKAELAGYAGVSDLDDDLDEGQRELQLALKPSSRPIGLSVAELGTYVRNALFGAEARRITRNREDVKIMVRYPEEYRENVDQIESMWIPTLSAAGERSWVPLGEIATVTEAEGYTTIHRSRQQRAISVFAEVDAEHASTFEILGRIRSEWIPQIREEHPDVRFEFLGSSEEQAKAFSSLKTAFPAALLLVYMMLAGLFRSYLQPLVVMAVIPFGIQ
ncbi:MAG: efflux RND transporter permease subunit, partial [Planctomycetaceae bacterium]